MFLYFCKYRIILIISAAQQVSKLADQLAAMGAEPRLRIMRLLLAAHPQGLVVGEIQEELGIPGSTLSHHLDKLKLEGLVNVRRESQFHRYTANAEALRGLLAFLFAECCSGKGVVRPDWLVEFQNQEGLGATPSDSKEQI